jgi:succinoglycan biosynthesis transport protein ExoP
MIKTIDLREYWRVVKHRKLLFFLPILIVSIVALGGSFTLKPVYKSSTTILIGQTKLLSPSIENIVPGSERERASSREEREQKLATIKNQIISTAFLSRLIEVLSLDRAPWVEKTAQKLKEKFPSLPLDELKKRILIEGLQKSIEVQFKGENLVEIIAYSMARKQAQDMAKSLADIFIQENLKYELLGIRGAQDFSDEQLTVYKKKLEDSENRLRIFKQQELRSTVDENIANTSNIEEIKSVTDAVKLEIRDNEQNINNLKESIGKSEQARFELRLSSRLTSLKDNLKSLTKQYGDLLVKYSWKDAKVLTLTEKTRNNLDEIKDEIKTLILAQAQTKDASLLNDLGNYWFLKFKLDYLKDKAAMLQVSVDNLRNIMARRPYYEQTLTSLQNEVESNRRIYEAFLSQSQGTQISQQVQQAEAENKFRIIEPASFPLNPVKPDKKKIVLLGVLLGLVLGVGAVLVAEFTDSSLRNIEEAEEYLGLKVLGTIPKADFLEKFFRKKN